MTINPGAAHGSPPGLALGVVEAFGLGTDPRIEGPAQRGHRGQVWRLATSTGRYAVKVPTDSPEVTAVADDTAYQEAVRATGVSMPAVVRTVDGAVLAEIAGVVVRVYEWVDIDPPDRSLDTVAVGRAVAAIHAVDLPCDRPVDPWFTDPVGGDAWQDLAGRARVAGAPFAADLQRLVPEFTALEEVLRPPMLTRRCHRDLWADNVRTSHAGVITVLDWENSGPADPAGELPMLMVEFGSGDPRRMRTLYAAYLTAGGPARVTGHADCSMVVATLGHIVAEGVRRWMGATAPDDRAEHAAWVAEGVGEPLTRRVIDTVVAVAAEVNADLDGRHT